MKIALLLGFLSLICNFSIAQGYWQQRVEYQIDIDFDVSTHQFNGKQTLIYYNNSPDTLFNVYYHLYFNAFQPSSMMDVRSRNINDPDGRVMDRIGNLKPNEIGYQEILNLRQNGKELDYEVSETVLEVKLREPIPPGASSTFSMKFKAQVPLQVRRSGRDSHEGIDYSMSQWFPKMAEYDEDGWHTSPYIAREFYAPWGNYDVKITIDKAYVLAGTGILQNPEEVGYGYEKAGMKVRRKGKNITWHFRAENVHDFMWAADTEYTHTTIQVPDGPLVRFFYVPGDSTKLWNTELPGYTVKAFQYIQKHFGAYGWSQYSIIQGGDGGMEYPMATLIANDRKDKDTRSLKSLVGVMVHEVLHSWYQGMMATNESYFAWMDEGFTSFAENYTVDAIMRLGSDPMESDYDAYFEWAKTGMEEPMTTHSDHFKLNKAYSRASYTKGAITLEQLGYVIGDNVRDRGLLQYHKEWSFKHPDMGDFIRVMEQASGITLDWYFDYWIKTTETIDYAIQDITNNDENQTTVTLKRLDQMPMPIEVVVTRNSGSKMLFYIPLGIMRGEKSAESTIERIILKDWAWTHPEYQFDIDIPYEDIVSIEIDPSGRLADIDRSNNKISITRVH
jgi:hypothetical protein